MSYILLMNKSSPLRPRGKTRIKRTRGDTHAKKMLEQLLEIGRALASEKDLDSLLGMILAHARSLTNADGASIYTRDAQGKL